MLSPITSVGTIPPPIEVDGGGGRGTLFWGGQFKRAGPVLKVIFGSISPRVVQADEGVWGVLDARQVPRTPVHDHTAHHCESETETIELN